MKINVGRSVLKGLEITGMTRTEFSEASGMSQPLVSRAANYQYASCPKIETLAKAFKMKPSEFIALGEK